MALHIVHSAHIHASNADTFQLHGDRAWKNWPGRPSTFLIWKVFCSYSIATENSVARLAQFEIHLNRYCLSLWLLLCMRMLVVQFISIWCIVHAADTIIDSHMAQQLVH